MPSTKGNPAMERDRDVIDEETYTARRSGGNDRLDDRTTSVTPDATYGEDPGATTDGFASTDAGVTPDAAYRDDSYLDATTPDGAVRANDTDAGYATAGTPTDGGLDDVDDVDGRREHGAEALGAGAGALGGAAIGMAVGGPPGAVIGGLVGAAAGAIAGEAAEGDDEAGSGMGGVGGAAAGAVIGGAVGGPPGAVVGGAVGAGAGAGAGDKVEERAKDETEASGHDPDEGTLNDRSVRDTTY
ncbi:MAG TPA: glycine zipper domain-containing protein [Candidatus Limnocylindrales bacterium]|nr:glycine zipper domain-containing protein [Candidatus Limnocylindrales bacterium]